MITQPVTNQMWRVRSDNVILFHFQKELKFPKAQYLLAMLILELCTYLHKETFINTIHSGVGLISLILGDSFLTRNLKLNPEKNKYNEWTFDLDMELVPSSKLFTFQQEGCHFSRSVTVTENHFGKFW